MTFTSCVWIEDSLYRKILYKNDENGEPAAVLFFAAFEDGLKIVPKGVVDPDVRFRIDPKALRNWRVNTKKIDVTILENGLLQQLNAQFDDRTAAIIESTAKTAINVGKTVALAAASTLKEGVLEKVTTFDVPDVYDPDRWYRDTTAPIEPFPSLAARVTTEATNNLIKDELIAPTAGGDKIAVSIVFAKPTLTIQARAGVVAGKNGVQTTYQSPAPPTGAAPTPGMASAGIIPAVQLHAPIQLATTSASAVTTASAIAPGVGSTVSGSLQGGVSVAGKNQATGVIRPSSVSISSELGGDNIPDRIVRFVTFENFRKDFIDGVVTRIPAYVSVEGRVKAESLRNDSVKQGTTEVVLIDPAALPGMFSESVFSAQVPVAQFGRLGVVPVHSNTFVEQSRGVTLNSDSGQVNVFNHSSTSSGETFAKMLESISKSVVDELPGLLQAASSAKGGASGSQK